MKARRTAERRALATAAVLLLAVQASGADLELLEFLGDDEDGMVLDAEAPAAAPVDKNVRTPAPARSRNPSDDTDEDDDPTP